MANFFNYAPDSVDVLIAGFIPVQGYVNGTFINITKDVVPFTPKRTPDGSVARVHHRDLTYTITLTLHNGSSSNDLLTKVWLFDEVSGGRGKFPLLMKDHSGTDLFFSTNTWIETPASIVKSTSIDERVWTLRSAHAVINVGSNEETSPTLDDIFNATIAALPGLQNLL